METNDRLAFATAMCEMKHSLDTAVQNAGGSIDVVCSIDRLKTTNVYDFMCQLATNNVRFVCIKPAN